MLTGEVVDFHVLTSDVNSLRNIAISTSLHYLLLAWLVLTQTILLFHSIKIRKSDVKLVVLIVLID